MREDVVQSKNIEQGSIVVYVHGYGKNKCEYLGEFKGYEGNKVRIGRWEFKDQVVNKERLLGLFHSPENSIYMGVEK